MLECADYTLSQWIKSRATVLFIFISFVFSGAWNAPVWALEHCVVDPLLPYTHLGGQSGDTQVSISADFSSADFEQADFSGSVKLHQAINIYLRQCCAIKMH
ncbi:hypothetical protein [Rappaport israeli]|uniref:hypothetical protein n=1 Tax=Rappaport israeli TaxID=1839807 RepID=UPI001178B29E|nr:hypothetical protein [Rappaport israeli]